MDEGSTPRLQAQIDALVAERDAAISHLERVEQEREHRQQLLAEEQDRFVSHLIEVHERQIARLGLELGEARSATVRVESKLERQREATAALENQLARVRGELTRLRVEKDGARAEALRVEEGLRAELELARTMLSDAMSGATGNAPPRSGHEPQRETRDSGVVGRGHGAARRLNTPPPAAARGGRGRRTDSPPPSR